MVVANRLESDELGNDSEEIMCSAAALDQSIVATQTCIHDSAANRHVFHTRYAFIDYEYIDPVIVKGFGRELKTQAIGKGTVRVKGWVDGEELREYLLTNCLHIPSARYNLISQAQFNHKGIEARVGGGNITQSRGGKRMVTGKLNRDDMYKLNMIIDAGPIPILDPIIMAAVNASNEALFYTA